MLLNPAARGISDSVEKRTWTRENWRVLHGIMVINAPTNTHVVHSTLYHLPQHPRLRQVGHVDEDIVGWVSVQRCTQSLLVKVVSDETDRAAKHEQAVQRANLDARESKDIITWKRCQP